MLGDLAPWKFDPDRVDPISMRDVTRCRTDSRFNQVLPCVVPKTCDAAPVQIE